MPDDTKPDHAAAESVARLTITNGLHIGPEDRHNILNVFCAYLARDEQYKQAVEDVRVTLEALKDIYQCMGGDDSAAKGWNAPEDVWEIALDAITAIRARYPEPDDAR